MKNLIKQILKEGEYEKIVKILNNKFQINQLRPAYEFLDELGFKNEEIKGIFSLWYADNGLKVSVENILKFKINIDDLFFEWGYYNCGLGECCDPEYIAISRDHQDEVFKIVNQDYINRYFYSKQKRGYEDLPEICMDDPEEHIGEYKTLSIIDEDLYEDLIFLFGDETLWATDLVEFINNKFNTKIDNFMGDLF
jgi:hypothetical protein